MTEGVHYCLDYVSFSRLLGFGAADRSYPSLYDGVDTIAYDDIQHMYFHGKEADFHMPFLRSYYYVLNNMIRHTLDPKIGDTTSILHDAPKILLRFGEHATSFSISDLLWRKIHEAANDHHKSLPYAPCLMYIIEQVMGRCFYHSTQYPQPSIQNLLAPQARALFGPKGEGLHPSRAPSCSTPTRDTSRRGGARSSSGRGACRGRGGAVKYALQMIFSAFCYKAEKDDRRLHRIEDKLGLEPSSPLRQFCYPFEEYAELSRAAGGRDDDEDESDNDEDYDADE